LVTALPIVLFIAWAFELTPEGMKRTSDVTVKDSETNQTGRTLNYAMALSCVDGPRLARVDLSDF